MYAGFWRRFAAVFIDSIIIGIASAIVSGVLSVVTLGAVVTSGPGAAIAALLIQVVISLGGQWLYFALMESSSNQATLGKMVFGIKVVGPTGERIGFGRATGRYFGKFLSGLILSIGYIMAAFTDKKQALHDMLASTYVVHREVEPADIERGYYDGQPRLSGLVVGIAVVAGFFVPIFFIGILAAIAIPAYQDYTIRAQVTEGLNLASQTKVQIVESAAKEGKWPSDTELVSPPNLRFVKELHVSHGTITIVYGREANAKLQGQTLAIQPLYTQTGAVFWRCGRARIDERTHLAAREGQTPSEDSASATTLADKYLPSSCRASA